MRNINESHQYWNVSLLDWYIVQMALCFLLVQCIPDPQDEAGASKLANKS